MQPFSRQKQIKYRALFRRLLPAFFILLVSANFLTAQPRPDKKQQPYVSSARMELKRGNTLQESYFQLELRGSCGYNVDCDTKFEHTLKIILFNRTGDTIRVLRSAEQSRFEHFCSWDCSEKIPYDLIRMLCGPGADTIRMTLFQTMRCDSFYAKDTSASFVTLTVPEAIDFPPADMPQVSLLPVTENIRTETEKHHSGFYIRLRLDQSAFRRALAANPNLSEFATRKKLHLTGLVTNEKGQKCIADFGDLRIGADTFSAGAFVTYAVAQFDPGTRNCTLNLLLTDPEGFPMATLPGSLSFTLSIPKRSLVTVSMKEFTPARTGTKWYLGVSNGSGYFDFDNKYNIHAVQRSVRYGDDDICIFTRGESSSSSGSGSGFRMPRNPFMIFLLPALIPIAILKGLGSRGGGGGYAADSPAGYYYSIAADSSREIRDSTEKIKSMHFTVRSQALPELVAETPQVTYGEKFQYSKYDSPSKALGVRVRGRLPNLPDGMVVRCHVKPLPGDKSSYSIYDIKPRDWSIDSLGNFELLLMQKYRYISMNTSAIQITFCAERPKTDSIRNEKESWIIGELQVPLRNAEGSQYAPKCGPAVYSDTLIGGTWWRQAAFTMEMKRHYLLDDEQKFVEYRTAVNINQRKYLVMEEQVVDTSGGVQREIIRLRVPYYIFNAFPEGVLLSVYSKHTGAGLKELQLAAPPAVMEQVEIKVHGVPRRSGYGKTTFYVAYGASKKYCGEFVRVESNSLPAVFTMQARKGDPVYVEVYYDCKEHWQSSRDYWLKDTFPAEQVSVKRFHSLRLHDRGRWKGMQVTVKRR